MHEPFGPSASSVGAPAFPGAERRELSRPHPADPLHPARRLSRLLFARLDARTAGYRPPETCSRLLPRQLPARPSGAVTERRRGDRTEFPPYRHGGHRGAGGTAHAPCALCGWWTRTCPGEPPCGRVAQACAPPAALGRLRNRMTFTEEAGGQRCLILDDAGIVVLASEGDRSTPEHAPTRAGWWGRALGLAPTRLEEVLADGGSGPCSNRAR